MPVIFCETASQYKQNVDGTDLPYQSLAFSSSFPTPDKGGALDPDGDCATLFTDLLGESDAVAAGKSPLPA